MEVIKMQGAGKPKASYGVKSRRERDEDLILFREIFKREKERNVISLLEPVSTELEPSQGSFPLYKLPSGNKGAGSDFLGADREKSDFDWLKTPPATPLFPSLEMEANDPSLIFQRELPILQPIRPSRFSTKMEEAKLEQREKSPSSRSTTSTKSYSSSRSETSSSRPTSSSGNTTTLRRTTNRKEGLKTPVIRSENRNTSSPRKQNSERKTQSRGISPMTRPGIHAKMTGFLDATPQNLITTPSVIQGRATSATRGRPGSTKTLLPTIERATSATRGRPGSMKTVLPTAESKVEDRKNIRRESCSPSVSRGKKAEFGEQNLSGNKAKASNGMGNGTMVIGSKMVEKMMNARISAGREETESKVKEKPGVGRLMSRTSLDIALKHWEINKNPVGLKSSANTGPTPRLSTQTTPSSDVMKFRARTSGENKFPINQKCGNMTKN